MSRRGTHCRAGHAFAPETTIVDRATGLRRCRICRNAKARRRWAKQHAALHAERAERAQRQTKPCTGCKVEKPLDDFSKNKACRDGRKPRCRQCERESAAQWRRDNPEEARAAWRKFAKAHPEKVREKNRRLRHRWGPAAAKKAVERATAWARENPGKAKANKANHRAAKLRATPPWANRDEIRAIYQVATSLGPDFHVDHIIPLQGKTVCGLHCEANLRIIPARVNISKHNVRWPDMFESEK